MIARQVPVTIFIVPSYTDAGYQRDAEDTLNTAVAQALSHNPGAPVITPTIQDRAAIALTNEAEHAELLVVGGHGHGELPGIHPGASPVASSRVPPGKDCMEVTGARWSPDSAEAVLRLRALAGNGDFDDYFAFTSNSKDNATTTAATSNPSPPPHNKPSPKCPTFNGAAPLGCGHSGL